MVDYNVSLGKGKDVQQLSSSDMKGGVKKEDIKDDKMKSIFSMLDTNNNGILENEEITKINNAISQFAQEDGDASNLSKKEAKHLIAALGLKGIKVDDLFKFLGTVKAAASNIIAQTIDTDGSKAIDVEYKADNNGNKVTKQYDSKTGNLTGSYTVDKDGNEFWQDANGKVTKGKDEVGNYTRKYNDDGSYIDTYENNKGTKKYTSNGLLIGGSDTDGIEYQREYKWGAGETGYTDAYTDGRIRNYDTNGRWISGTATDGTTYTNEYKEDGSFTKTWSNGMVQEYDKNNRQLSGKLPDGRTWTNKYHEDGSFTRTWSDGVVQEYDKNNRRLSGKLPNGVTYTNKYHEDGSFTATYSDGEVHEYDKNNRQLSVKLPDGRTWTNEYNDDGSYTKTYSHGEVQKYDKNDKMLNGTLANGTTFEAKYNEQGELKYNEFSRKDGSKYYYGADNKSYAEKTANGSLKVNPKQGETFNKTMERLGITDPADQELFIKSNPKAYKRGYFLLADSGKVSGDVYIPKAIADKLDINNVLVDKTAEYEKHKQARKTPSMGI